MVPEDNLVIGASRNAPEDFQLGRVYRVWIRQRPEDEYMETNIHIVRLATVEEYVAYHEREGIPYVLCPGDTYFAFLMD